MAKSLRINFIYNILNTVSGLLFPLITFPYASRILMAEGIGQVQFFSSIINYILLFSSIGIPLYGIREIARVRDNERDLSKTTLEILILNLLLNVIGYIVVVVLCLTVTKIQVNIPLFLILSASIVLTTIGCSWFYSGIEEFKYITLRGICVKVVCVIYLLLVVKDQNDLLEYGFYTVIGTIGNNILNFIRLKKYVRFTYIRFSELSLKKHLKPACEIFLFNIITSIYLNLDKVMLGFMQSDDSVGYYTAATNLSHVLLYSVTSLGAVVLPRASNLIKNNKKEEFANLSSKAYHFIFLLGIPISFGCIILAEPLIHLFCGNSFLPAITTLRIIAPIIIFIGISNIIGMQVLYPLGKIKYVTISTSVGACINVVLNLILIPLISQNGAALATVFAEFSVTFTQIYIAYRIIPFRLFDKYIVQYLLLSLALSVICFFIGSFISVGFIKIIVVLILYSLLYVLTLVLIRDPLICEVLSLLKIKYRNEI